MNVSEQPAVETAAPKTRAAKPRPRAPKPPAKRNRHTRPTRQAKAHAARPGTKTAKILALLRRPSGATLQQLRKATDWQAHSVRGFLSGVLKRQLKLNITSVKGEGSQRAYRLVC
jgi:Protein of unknown function (DUF3489)